MEKILNKDFVSTLRSLDEGQVYFNMMKEIAMVGYCVIRVKIERDLSTADKYTLSGIFFPSESVFSPNERYDEQKYEHYHFTKITNEFFTKFCKEFHHVRFNDNVNGSYYIISCEPLGDEIINCLKRSIVKKYRNY